MMDQVLGDSDLTDGNRIVAGNNLQAEIKQCNKLVVLTMKTYTNS